MRIHVCSLSRLAATVQETGASHVLTLINVGTPVTRPANILEDHHLFLGMHDITEPMDGYLAPAEAQVDELLAFVRRWDRAAPLVIHCFAGVSRSTAAAYIAACALSPGRDEAEIAQELRASSPTATPNRRLVALADAKLGREGRMLQAIDAIGRGQDCQEGVPFCFGLEAESDA